MRITVFKDARLVLKRLPKVVDGTPHLPTSHSVQGDASARPKNPAKPHAIGFDDPEASEWEGEELDVAFEHAHRGEELLEELLLGDLEREEEADSGSLQRFEAEVQSYMPNTSAARPSAMCLSEECPALLDGIV